MPRQRTKGGLDAKKKFDLLVKSIVDAAEAGYAKAAFDPSFSRQRHGDIRALAEQMSEWFDTTIEPLIERAPSKTELERHIDDLEQQLATAIDRAARCLELYADLERRLRALERGESPPEVLHLINPKRGTGG